jgi:hypothetical protein
VNRLPVSLIAFNWLLSRASEHRSGGNVELGSSGARRDDQQRPSQEGSLDTARVTSTLTPGAVDLYWIPPLPQLSHSINLARGRLKRHQMAEATRHDEKPVRNVRKGNDSSLVLDA